MVEKLYVFITESDVQPKWIAMQKDMYEGAPRELQEESDTQ